MSWLYKGAIFTEDMIPDDAVGFIYMMTAIIDNKSVKYIGKKNFFANVKIKLSKKALPTDKRLKKYKRVKKFTYKDYYSSNEILIQAHKDGVDIKREILYICYSKIDLSYQEVKHQFMYNVLEDDSYLNGNILGKFYKTKQLKEMKK
jgi:hypothetical protein